MQKHLQPQNLFHNMMHAMFPWYEFFLNLVALYAFDRPMRKGSNVNLFGCFVFITATIKKSISQ